MTLENFPHAALPKVKVKVLDLSETLWNKFRISFVGGPQKKQKIVRDKAKYLDKDDQMRILKKKTPQIWVEDKHKNKRCFFIPTIAMETETAWVFCGVEIAFRHKSEKRDENASIEENGGGWVNFPAGAP